MEVVKEVSHHAKKAQFETFFGKALLTGMLVIILAVSANSFFHIPWNTIFFAGILLLCPLLHLWMMSGDKHKH